MSVFTRLVAVALGVGLTLGSAFASQIALTGVAGFPHGRTSGDNPENAIDGSTATFTWTTNSFTTDQPAYLAISFGDTDVNRIRLWKEADGGGGPNIKDLVIMYTTDTGGDLTTRSYTAVSGLANGFFGTEFLDATSVNSDGTVIGDVHASSVDGWASLTFNTVHATGVAIAFSAGGFNHYRVGEFEAYYHEELLTASPEPGTILLFSCGLGAVVFARRRRS